jgi:hypothetical protein
MERRGKSGTIAGSILGLAAAVIFNVLTAAPPDERTVQAAAPSAITQSATQNQDPCKLPDLKSVSLKPQSATRRARSAS